MKKRGLWMLVSLVVGLSFWAPPASQAASGDPRAWECGWNVGPFYGPASDRGKGLSFDCSRKDFFAKQQPDSMACLEVRNKTQRSVAFSCDTTGNDPNCPKKYWIQNNSALWAKLGPGQSKKADFSTKGYTTRLGHCRQYKNGNWQRVACGDVLSFKIIRTVGGGCGCRGFSCLPREWMY